MVDNVQITPGSGNVIAADELTDGTLGTVKVQYVKLMDGTIDGTTKAVVNANGLKVDGSGVTQPISGTISISGTTTVSGTVTANQGGTWTVQPGNTANTTPWLVSAAQSGAWTVAATQSGTWNITNISGTISLPTGAATSANQPSNAALGSTTSGQTGHLALGAVTTAAPTYTTAQSNALSLTTAGALRTDASATTQPISGSVSISGTVGVTQSTSPWVVSLTSTTITGTVAVTQSGSWSLAANQSVNTAQINGVAPLMGNGVTGTGSQRVTIASDNTAFSVNAVQSGTWTVQQGTPPWTVNGDTASGATDANNPLKIGGVARTSNPTAVTNGQRVNAIFDKLGKQVVVGAVRALMGVQKTSISVSTETTVVTAGAAGVFNDVYAIVVTNKSATAVFVDFRDATAGTVRMTLAAPAGDTRGFTVPVDSAMVQATAANNWTATLSGAASTIEISMLYTSNL
jgi:hypothetical protein